jgi:hypothetical protein
VLALAAACAGAWYGMRYYAERHVTIGFAHVAAVPELELTFFPEQMAFAAPSPPPPLGTTTLTGGDALTVGSDLVPERSVLRYQGEGVGAGFAYVELGKQPPTIELRAPTTLSGRVGEPLQYWCMGWRCDGYLPIADAEVVVMGGGEHGVDLARTRTDEQGHFTVSGFDGELDALGLRLRAPGFELVHQRIEALSEHVGERAILTMTRVPPRRGRVVVEQGVDLKPADLLLLARGLPGVEARPAEDGTFVFDHIPPDVEARIVVYGLPPLAAQTDVRTERDGEIEVRVVRGAIVRGRVLGENLEPMPRALVWFGRQRAVRTDDDGAFELQNVLPGQDRLVAQWQPKRRRAKPWLSARTLDLEAGRTYERVEIVLER